MKERHCWGEIESFDSRWGKLETCTRTCQSKFQSELEEGCRRPHPQLRVYWQLMTIGRGTACFQNAALVHCSCTRGWRYNCVQKGSTNLTPWVIKKSTDNREEDAIRLVSAKTCSREWEAGVFKLYFIHAWNPQRINFFFKEAAWPSLLGHLHSLIWVDKPKAHSLVI